MNGIIPYWGLFRTRFRALLQYRAAALAGIVTQILFGLVRVMILHAFYRFGGPDQPMTYQQAVSYTWIGQAMLGLLPWSIEPEIGQSVRTGQVAYDLARPLDLYWMWYVRCIAQRAAPTLLKSVPQFLFSVFILPAPYNLVMPPIEVFGGWLAAILGALLLSAAITSLMNVSLFWTVSGEGVIRFLPVLVLLLSGGQIPLPLYPDFLQTFLKYQPFFGLVDGPSRIFTEHIPLSRLPEIIALQLLWTLAFVILCRILMKRGLKRVTIAGG